MQPLIAAVMLAFMIQGQHPTSRTKPAPPAKLLAPAPPSAYRFSALVTPGMTIGQVTLPADVTIDSATAFNDQGEAAFIARWNDASGRQMSALFTSRRMVVAEGEALEGRTIVRLSGAALAINSAGLVAYEASYADASSPSGIKTGVFVERRFMADLSISGTDSDFVLLGDGRVAGRDGLILTQPAPVVAAAVTPNPQPPAKTPSSGCSGVNAHLSQKAKDWLKKHSPIQTDSGDPVADASKACNAPPPGSAPSPVTPQPQLPPTRPLPERVTLPAAPRSNCQAPSFPMPAEWQMGADLTGPIASHGFDSAQANRSYDSPFYGKLANPIRTIQYSGDCKPLLIAIGDTATRGRFELWTPEGSFTYLKPDGSWSFPGFEPRINSASFVRPDSGLRINRHGQILVPVTLPQGMALLIATPGANR